MNDFKGSIIMNRILNLSFILIIILMGLYYYKSWVDWHFKNKNFDAKFQQTATIQVAPKKSKREW